MTLDEAIREAAREGRLTMLTLVKGRDGKWQAARRANKGDGYQVEAGHDDPVDALHEALGRPLGLETTHGRDVEGGIFG